MVTSYWTSVWSTLLIGLLMGGCNVFSASAPSPDAVEALLADARTALASGNAARAVTLLERAYAKDSTDVQVRIELGNALYRKHGFDVPALRAVAEHFVGDSDSTSATGQTRSVESDEVCTRGADPDTRADRYRLVQMDAEVLRRLAERDSVVARVQRLVVEGVFERRPARLQSAGVRVRRKGFLVGATTVITKELIAAHRILRGSARSLYLDRAGKPPRAFVACAQNESALMGNHKALCALSDATRQGVKWLRTRNRLSGRDEESTLVDRLQALAHASSARTTCSQRISVPIRSGRPRN